MTIIVILSVMGHFPGLLRSGMWATLNRNELPAAVLPGPIPEHSYCALALY